MKKIFESLKEFIIISLGVLIGIPIMVIVFVLMLLYTIVVAGYNIIVLLITTIGKIFTKSNDNGLNL